jgi:hypothetical protein
MILAALKRRRKRRAWEIEQERKRSGRIDLLRASFKTTCLDKPNDNARLREWCEKRRQEIREAASEQAKAAVIEQVFPERRAMQGFYEWRGYCARVGQ